MPVVNSLSIMIALALLLPGACSREAVSPAPRQTSSKVPAAAVPGQVIVQFHAGTTAQQIERVLKATGTDIERQLSSQLVYLLRFSGDVPIEAMVQRLKTHPEVQHVEPNRIIRLEPPHAPGLKRN